MNFENWVQSCETLKINFENEIFDNRTSRRANSKESRPACDLT
jgi:hypothetical protein